MGRSLTFVRAALASFALANVALLARVACILRESAHPRVALTAAAALLAIAGAVAALRGRVWGLVLTTAAAVALGGVALYGIAPPYFLTIAMVGLAPAMLAAPSLLRADRGAAVGITIAALGAGALAVAIAGPGIDAGLPMLFLALVPLVVAGLIVLAFLQATRAERAREAAAASRAREIAEALGVTSPETGSTRLAWDRDGQHVSLTVHPGGLGATVSVPAMVDAPVLILPRWPLGRDAADYVGRTLVIARVEDGRDVIEVGAITSDAASGDEASLRARMPADLPRRMLAIGTEWIELDGATLSFITHIPEGPFDAATLARSIDEAIALAGALEA